MNFDTSQLTAVAPEITLLTLACVVLLVDLFVKEESRIITGLLTIGSLLVTAIVVYAGVGGGVTAAL